MAPTIPRLALEQRRSAVNIFLISAVMFCVIIASVPAPALEPLALYDDFSSSNIDPDKWVGSEVSSQGSQGREAVRTLKQHSLRLGYVGYCETTSDNGDCETILELNFTNPAAVTAMQAVITPYQVVTAGCVSNSLPTFAAARLYGAFFNTGSRTPGSNVNDIVARIQVGRSSDSTDPVDVLRVNARVYQCQDPDCFDGSQLYVQDLGAITIGQSTTVTMQWDQPTHRFLFQRDNQAAVVFPYALLDITPPGRPEKRVDASVDVPSCTTTPRPQSLIQALIDNVLVNQSAVP
jgi:hypothetical protein